MHISRWPTLLALSCLLAAPLVQAAPPAATPVAAPVAPATVRGPASNPAAGSSPTAASSSASAVNPGAASNPATGSSPAGTANPTLQAGPASGAPERPAPEYVQRSEEIMHTRIDVALPDGPEVDAAAEAVFRVFREIEEVANEWRDPSPLAAINKSAGGAPVAAPAELCTLLHRGIDLGEKSSGAFDITWAALWGLWDFNASKPAVPTPAQINPRLALIDYRKVELHDTPGGCTVRLPEKGMKIGLGGIAKGYSLDLAAAELRRRGISSFLISAGGQIMAGGQKGARPWRIGVRDPRSDGSDYFAMLEVSDNSLSSSGDYERYFIQKGVRYHHILDPRTGMPAQGLRGVTVITSNATLADGLSTALMVLGIEKGLALAERLPGVDAVMVDDQGAVHVSSGLKDRLIAVHPPANPTEAPSPK